ncbi:MAG: MATE family efflux transporter [Pseudomonadota bacterium]
MADQTAKFLEGSLLKHITVMSVTTSVGFILLFVVDLVDMLFISMLGNAQLAAAVGFAGSILFFTTSAGIGLSIAAGSLIARSLGEGDAHRAREYMTHVMILGFIFAVIFAGSVWLSLDYLVGLIGATGEAKDFAISYLQIIIPTMPILMIGMVASAALRSHGAAVLSTAATIAAGLTNAILDPIFIFVLDMGLNGAAWASVVARIAMAATALWPIFRRYGGFGSFQLSALAVDVRPILALAVPAILANIAAPVGGAYVTRAAAEFGQDAVAGMAVIGRVTPIAFALIFAMSGAIGPIIGQNYGAQKFDRVRRAYLESLYFIIGYVVLMVLILLLLRNHIANVFGLQGLGRDLVLLFCGPLSLAWIFNGIIFMSNASFNNLGHPFYSTWINWGRNTIGIIPFVYIGAQYWGAEGVLIGQMMGGALIAAVALYLANRTMRAAEAIPQSDAKKERFAGHRRVFQMLNHRH